METITGSITNWIAALFAAIEGALTKIAGNTTLGMFAIGIPIVAMGLSYLGAIVGKRLKPAKGRRR
jgi:hypothetical protein